MTKFMGLDQFDTQENSRPTPDPTPETCSVCGDTGIIGGFETQPCTRCACKCGHFRRNHYGDSGQLACSKCECPVYSAPDPTQPGGQQNWPGQARGKVENVNPRSQSDPTQPEKQQITGDTSDGYHTFNELYEFRKLYNAALFNEWAKGGWYGVHKSKLHSDGEVPFGGGWFVASAQLPTGQITNHYELKDWDLFRIPENTRAAEWDGHTPQDVAKRLTEYLRQS